MQAMKSYRATTPRRGRNRGNSTLLHRVYNNMRGRVRGTATRAPWLYKGIALAWKDFDEFRKWALANGFSKATPSPERMNAKLGYVPGNVVFVTKQHNSSTARGKSYYSDYEVRGEEPPESDVPF